MVFRRRRRPHAAMRTARSARNTAVPGALRRRVAAAVVTLLLVATGCDSAGGDGDSAQPSAEPRPERWRLDYVTESDEATLFDIAAAGRDDGWAIGQESTDFVLLHRHGGSWRPARMPLPASHGGLFNIALDASAPDNVWLFAGMSGFDSAGGASGEYSRTPVARRWDGHRWRSIPIDFTVLDTVVLAPDDVWALDSSLDHDRFVARHWDGKRWSPHILPYPTIALGASGPNDLWAVGWREDASGRTDMQPALMHFGGKAWRSIPVPADRFAQRKPNEQSKLTEVVAVSRDNAWAFGDHSYLRDEPGSEFYHVSTAWHWDGKRWRKVPNVPHSRVGIHPFPEMAATGDGAGGFVLGGHQHGTADGTIRVIDDPAPPAAPSEPNGQATASSNLHPIFESNDVERVPGTREVWSAGFVNSSEYGGSGRGAIAVCTLHG